MALRATLDVCVVPAFEIPLAARYGAAVTILYDTSLTMTGVR